MRRIILVLILVGACTPKAKISTIPMGLSTAAWLWHPIVPAGLTPYRGADGVHVADVQGEPSVCSPWEQGGIVTVAKLDGTTTNPNVGANPGAEDAKCHDYDLPPDGKVDVASASEGSKRVAIQWGDFPSTTKTVIAAATNVTKWMQLAWKDVTGDGVPDLIAGGKNGSAPYTASWGYFTTAAPRSAGAWTYHQVALVGWTMTLTALDFDQDGDQDVFLTDRTGAAQQSTQKGSWWFENSGTGTFTPHHIAHVTGDPGMGLAEDLDGDGDTDVFDGNRTTMSIRWNSGDNVTFTTENVPKPDNTGDYHAVTTCGCGDEFALTFAPATGTTSGVVIIKRDAGAPSGWERIEVSGLAGDKFDNAICVDVNGDGKLDVVTAEGGDAIKTDDLGVGWYERP